MKKIPYAIVIATDDTTEELRAALRTAANGPFRNLVLHAAPPMQIEPDYGFTFAGIATSLEWAIGMAEEAIVVRESGDDPEDTPETIAMHREELAKARTALQVVKDAIA